MAVRQQDVAEAAGIDRSSVSRILNDDPRALAFSEETRERVHRIAAEMGYLRNLPAATVRRGFDNATVAIITLGTFGNAPYHSQEIRVIRDLNGAGFGTKLYTGTDLRSILREVEGSRIRYVYLFASEYADREYAAEFCSRHSIRLALRVSVQEFPGFPVFDNDNWRNMDTIVDFLWKLGHRSIALYCGPHCYFVQTNQRHQGFLDSLRSHGAKPGKGRVMCEEFSEKALLELLRRALPTALCCIYPSLTVRVLFALTRWNICVPEEISVLSYGYYSENRAAIPTLTGLNDDGMDISGHLLRYFRAGNAKNGKAFSFLSRGFIIPGDSTAAPSASGRLSLRKKLAGIGIVPELSGKK
ncbi:MAG: HTH-type transcriptional regulator DegA [Lentisphaerae bacterium ADurb.Bin242]|nr:MAG: HTH-type transcriptional regulator DegA [Lentisphaerae bacterium ADurb.Bin242]